MPVLGFVSFAKDEISFRIADEVFASGECRLWPQTD